MWRESKTENQRRSSRTPRSPAAQVEHGAPGRGYIQITGKANYQNWSNEVTVDLVGHPTLAATPDIAAQIAVEGLDKGSFTGRSLNDYVNSAGTDFLNARRTINGMDRAGTFAGFAQNFAKALAGCR